MSSAAHAAAADHDDQVEIENEDELLLTTEEKTSQPPPKKKRKSAKAKRALMALANKTVEDIQVMSREELIEGMKILVDFAKEQTQPVVISEKEIATLRRTILKNIRVQLKWSSSAKGNGARLSTSILCSEELFKATFKTDQTKIVFESADDFFKILESKVIHGSARYSLLYVCDGLTASFVRSSKTVKILGKYKAL